MVVPNFFPNKLGLSPNFIKFDYFINNFPYVGTGTSLALVGCVASNSEPGTLDAAILISTDTPSYLEGAIIWDTSVTTILEGGASHSETLIATYGADAGRVFCAADEETVYYSIQSSDRIVSALWDPTVGVNINAEPPTTAPPAPPAPEPENKKATGLVILGIACVLGVIGGGIYFRRQKNKQYSVPTQDLDQQRGLAPAAGSTRNYSGSRV